MCHGLLSEAFRDLSRTGFINYPVAGFAYPLANLRVQHTQLQMILI